jgi:protein-L-isoaspartate(D-aspartate) O-methyltransferase
MLDTNPSLIAAMQAVPRELFAPPALAPAAYSDGDISLGQSRALLRPIKGLTCARATTCSMLGTGYSAAVLAHMGAAVVALETRIWRGRRSDGAADCRLARGRAL